MDEKFVLNEIRSVILLKNNIVQISPSDCNSIANLISSEVHKTISTTTLKRLFGFAESRHSFSKYTLAALFEYAGISGDIKANVVNNHDVDSSIHKLNDRALRLIKTKTTVPYQTTISRTFANADFKFFYESKSAFMAYVAPPGYGKTTLLCHLIEDFFLNANAPFRDAPYIYLNINSLLNRDNPRFNFDHALADFLGIPTQMGFLEYWTTERPDIKIVIFIYDFTNINRTEGLLNQVYNGLFDFIILAGTLKNVKVILEMRSVVWMQFYERIRHTNFFHQCFFAGHYFNSDKSINVPLLTDNEIRLILSNLKQRTDELDNKLLQQLRLPFNLGLLTRLKIELTPDPQLVNITFFELIDLFVTEKIYKTKYYRKKAILIKRIIELSYNGLQLNNVLKQSLILEIRAYQPAYLELISDDVLTEERSNNELIPIGHISFTNDAVFEYFVFQALLEKNDWIIDKALLAQIDNMIYSRNLRFMVIHWACRYAVKANKVGVIEEIMNLDFNSYERAAITNFTTSYRRYISSMGAQP